MAGKHRKTRYELSEAGWNNVDFALMRPLQTLKDSNEKEVVLDAVNIFGGPILKIKAFSASVGATANTSRGAGDEIIAQSLIPGDITGDFTLTEDSMLAFNKYWLEEYKWDKERTTPSIFNIPPLNMILTFSAAPDDIEHTKTVYGMRMTNYSFSTTQGSTTIERPISFVAADLHEDGFAWLGTNESTVEFLGIDAPVVVVPGQ